LLGAEVTTLKKIIPLGLMFFSILFNYTIPRDTKDVLVVTANGSSAEIIPFLKMWVNLPLATGFMLLYSKLSNVLSKEALFYTVITPFIAFFGLFGFVMYPLNNAIHPTALANNLLAVLGPRFLGPVSIYTENMEFLPLVCHGQALGQHRDIGTLLWICQSVVCYMYDYALFDMWISLASVFCTDMFAIPTVDEAKQFYPLFGLGANIALIFSGRTVKYFSNLRKNLGPDVDGWAISLKRMMSIVVLLGLVIYGIYWGANKSAKRRRHI
ncbi:hypothetical protein Taro_024379, partial [Colocasia esculenta]|nr:hypothetical protein [Colocasia esculenta]